MSTHQEITEDFERANALLARAIARCEAIERNLAEVLDRPTGGDDAGSTLLSQVVKNMEG